MDAHEHIYMCVCVFLKFDYFMHFLVDQFFSDSSLVHIFGVHRFSHQSGSDNTGYN
jgi:hypothetical protein